MNSITQFEIIKLHGTKNITLKLVDNTLILVGENGAGKSTILQIFYYLLSGQWSSLAKYQFESISITIDKKIYALKFSDITKSLSKIDRHLLNHLPSAVRQRIFMLLERSEGGLMLPELEDICHRYDIPLPFLLRQLDLFDADKKSKSVPIRSALDGIRTSLNAQLLYLPTYRRIEQELSLIFKGLDERELRARGRLLADQRKENTFVELIEFGMKDVEDAINATRKELERFARESLNNLTFSYLGDVVEHKYISVDLKKIKHAEPKTIDNILNRIQEPILSFANKQRLRDIINKVKEEEEEQNDHTQVICHYFTKLMTFHQELEKKEAKIFNFCRICNEYMGGKEFKI